MPPRAPQSLRHPDDRLRGVSVLEDGRTGRCGLGAAEGARAARARGDARHAALPRHGARLARWTAASSRWRARASTCVFGEKPLGPGARVLFLDCPPLFDRAGIYNEGGLDYGDNAVRFSLLAAAAVDWHDSATRSPSTSSTRTTGSRASRPSICGVSATSAPSSPFTTWRIRASSTRRGCRWLGLSWADFTVNGFEFYDRLSFPQGRHQSSPTPSPRCRRPTRRRFSGPSTATASTA